MWQLDNLICDQFSVCDALLEDVHSKQTEQKKSHTWIWTRTLLFAIAVFKKIQGHTWIWTRALLLTMMNKASHHHATKVLHKYEPPFQLFQLQIGPLNLKKKIHANLDKLDGVSDIVWKY